MDRVMKKTLLFNFLVCVYLDFSLPANVGNVKSNYPGIFVWNGLEGIVDKCHRGAHLPISQSKIQCSRICKIL